MQTGEHAFKWRQGPVAGEDHRPYVTHTRPSALLPTALAAAPAMPACRPVLHSPSLTFTVINRAAQANNHALFHRLQQSISTGPGGAVPPPLPAAPAYPPRTPTGTAQDMPNGRASLVNGGFQQSPYAAYQQPAQPARRCSHVTTPPGGKLTMTQARSTSSRRVPSSRFANCC